MMPIRLTTIPARTMPIRATGALGDAKAGKGNHESQKRDGESDECHICILLK